MDNSWLVSLSMEVKVAGYAALETPTPCLCGALWNKTPAQSERPASQWWSERPAMLCPKCPHPAVVCVATCLTPVHGSVPWVWAGSLYPSSPKRIYLYPGGRWRRRLRQGLPSQTLCAPRARRCGASHCCCWTPPMCWMRLLRLSRCPCGAVRRVMSPCAFAPFVWRPKRGPC
jgi:hypothetical protein